RDGFESAATARAGAEDARETLLYGEELDPPLAVPGGFTAVVDLVRAPDQVARLVARLLRGAVLVADRTAGTRAVADHPELRAVTPAGEIITAVSYRGGMAADALLEVQARIRDAESALDRERQAALQAADEVERRATQRSALAREQPTIINEERRRWLEQAEILLAELASLEAAQLPDSASLTALEAQLREDEQANVALQVELAHADDACAAAAGEREAAQTEVERCSSALREGGQLVDDGEDTIEEVDWQKTEREVSRLQRRLDAMGAVNLLAPEEYAHVRERCEGLAGQLADLEAASAQLGALRERLEAEIDSRFRTVFQAVAVNFQEFFGELFEGGRATLRLETQPDGNPLDDGVEILAQTPGKRLQPLTLLSGGERALTALAFLFALQAVNPSPFYVLDEVDAALDDANVVRFNRVLKRLA